MLTAVRVTVEFHWGYSVKRPFFSASQPALAVPPPTALIGALARAAASIEGWPEAVVESGQPTGSQRGSTVHRLYSGAVRVLDRVLWASLALTDERFVSPMIGIVETRDIIRALIAPYQRRDNIYPGSALLFGVQPHGRVYAPSMRAHVLYLAKGSEAAAWAYAIQSIGSKESIVSVVDVEVGEARMREGGGSVETRYYFPVRLGSVEGGARFVREALSVPTREHFLMGAVHGVDEWEEFLVPLGRVNVRPTGDAALVEDPSGEVALVPRWVVGHA
ncbi:MAG: type I-A CRISPR-associated protein Cas5a [Thermofilaceae archaeon]